jgi:hypothetical protein
METMQAKPVADGQQPMTSADVVCKVLCVYQGEAPFQGSGYNLFLGMLVSRQAPPEQRHQWREYFRNSLQLNRKVLLPSLIKGMN